jgi:hypothetical protein
MKKSLFKSLKLYFQYRKILSSKKEELLRNFNMRVDRVFRLYTVINIPTDLIDEPYNLRKQDIDNLSLKYISDFSFKVSEYLNSIGLSELYDMYDIKKVDKYSYLVVIGFSLFRTDKVINSILFRWVPITLALSLLSYLIYQLFI